MLPLAFFSWLYTIKAYNIFNNACIMYNVLFTLKGGLVLPLKVKQCGVRQKAPQKSLRLFCFYRKGKNTRQQELSLHYFSYC